MPGGDYDAVVDASALRLSPNTDNRQAHSRFYSGAVRHEQAAVVDYNERGEYGDDDVAPLGAAREKISIPGVRGPKRKCCGPLGALCRHPIPPPPPSSRSWNTEVCS